MTKQDITFYNRPKVKPSWARKVTLDTMTAEERSREHTVTPCVLVDNLDNETIYMMLALLDHEQDIARREYLRRYYTNGLQR